ncbi:YggT family protein [Undibacterium sp. CY21W]|uniref:YggT family protein n=1 Tax=Undibacterium sp. CY21W TaxID=2762293 RepID=UPI00164AEB2D|nr:YggT family protein [Undibacterium sp. CY21W]
MLHGIFTFVIDILTGFFAGFLLLRFWMQVQRVRPPAGLAQAIFQITDWLVHPIRRVVPGFRGYDWATMVCVFLTALLSMVLDFWLLSEVSFSAILLLTVFRVLQWVLYGLMALLVLEAIFSWVNPHAPLAPFIRALNEPLLSPFRKVLPALGGLDFSPLLVLILLQILSRVLNELMPRLLML